MVVPSRPAFTASFPDSTGMLTLTRNRIDHLLINGGLLLFQMSPAIAQVLAMEHAALGNLCRKLKLSRALTAREDIEGRNDAPIFNDGSTFNCNERSQLSTNSGELWACVG